MQLFKTDLGQYLRIKNLSMLEMVQRSCSTVATRNLINAYSDFNFSEEVKMRIFDIIRVEIYIIMTLWNQARYLRNISSKR